MQNRIYLVTHSGNEMLVEAKTKMQALTHVANAIMTVASATQQDLIRLLPTVKVQSVNGGMVENVTADAIGS